MTKAEQNIIQYEERIAWLEREAESAGTIHKRDLLRHIKRLRKELLQYKAFLNESSKKV